MSVSDPIALATPDLIDSGCEANPHTDTATRAHGAVGAPAIEIPGRAGAVGGVERDMPRSNGSQGLAGRAVGSPAVKIPGRAGAVGGVGPRR